MNKAKLAQIAERLFGPRWKHDLAKALGLSWSQVHRMAQGTSPIPETTRRAIEGPPLVSDPTIAPPADKH